MLKLIEPKTIVIFILSLYFIIISILFTFYYYTTDGLFSYLSMFFKAISFTWLIIFILCFTWEYLWKKIPLLSKIFFPNLSGDWIITIEYFNKEDNKTKEIEGKCQIHQNIYSLSINIQTETSESETLSISAEKDLISGYIKLHYIYRNEVIKQDDSSLPDIYLGTAILKIKNDSNNLNGQYFTSRNGKGHFSLSRIQDENSNKK
ncbi:hypothetical protein LW139_14325 [Proteus vulgaris]|uniref:Cap15 family cyclic dinucleotide receptor domain-containing protein n=1 Tax=Proteus vulgaris TaxID=585 RepID=UPI002000016C|nr:hypothetical protein [Proteus vulgaris]UPK79987.1 hypothetical protein LW139_14325 [Proteus vulgaris]